MNPQKNLMIYGVILTVLTGAFSSLIVYVALIRGELPKFTAQAPKEIVEIPKEYSLPGEDSKESKDGIKNLKNLESSVKNIAKKISPKVVSIVISKDVQTYKTDPFGFYYEPSGVIRQKVGGGTGFFVNKDGIIITNKHVVGDPNASYSVITASGEEYIGKVLAIDPSTDLAIVKALTKDGKELSDTPAVKFSDDPKKTEVGNFVVAIGNALAEFQNTVTFGVISGIGRSLQAGDQNSQTSEQLTGLIQTDTAINPGNSGGPLVNLDEEVVGINTAIAAGANGLGFAIPLNQKEVDYLVSSVVKFGKIKRSFIGIRYISLNPNLAKNLKLKTEYGDYIGSGDNQEAVVPNSPAQKAGLKTGDTIIEVNGTKLSAGVSIKDIIKDKFPGDKISMKIINSLGEEKIIELTLGEM